MRLPWRSRVLRPACSRHRPEAARCIEGFGDFVTSIAAPIATGWSESCRVGMAPTEDQRLCTAHNDSRPLLFLLLRPYWGHAGISIENSAWPPIRFVPTRLPPRESERSAMGPVTLVSHLALRYRRGHAHRFKNPCRRNADVKLCRVGCFCFSLRACFSGKSDCARPARASRRSANSSAICS